MEFSSRSGKKIKIPIIPNNFWRVTMGQKLMLLYILLFLVCITFTNFFGVDYIQEKVCAETAETLSEAGEAILDHHIVTQDYTSETIQKLRSHILIGAETANCRIMIVSLDGDILIDTANAQVNDNVYNYNDSFLRESYTKDIQMGSLIREPVLAVPLGISDCTFLSGHIVMLYPMNSINERATYYFHILDELLYIFMATVLVIFILIYLVNVVPLKRVTKVAKSFSLRSDNPPIHVDTSDEYRDLADTLNFLGEEMGKYEEYQKAFIANISHDFRSPLTSIRGYTEAMLDGTIPPEKQEKYLNIIHFETERLTKLTSNLIALNTFDQKKIFLEYSDFDIHYCIKQTIDTLEGTANKKNIRLKLDFDSYAPLIVHADQGRIEQVLHNLIENAIKFSEKNSTVFILTRSKNDTAFITVKDTGIGIPKEDIQRVWERFYKSDHSRGKDQKGTGLGLSICKEIIDAHEQTISVASTEGAGTEFSFTLRKK